MTDTDLSPTWRRLASRLLGADDSGLPPEEASSAHDLFSEHSNRAEIAAETPIFHDLTLGWAAGRVEPAPRTNPLNEFRRDPLTAPIPMQVNSEPPATGSPARGPVRPAPAMFLVPSCGAHARPEHIRRHGRHHRPGR